MNAADGESVVTQSVDPRWHVAVGLAVAIGMPIFAACIIAGAVTGTEAYWWASFAVFLAILPFLVGLEFISRSIVRTSRGSLNGWRADVEIQELKVALVRDRLLGPSLEAVGFNRHRVRIALWCVWVGSGAVVLNAIVGG